MMLDAKKLSDSIRMKRKKVRADGVENMVDTAALPQMNPQDVWNMEKQAQMEETIPGAKDKMSAPGEATMEGPQADDSQDVADLKRKMDRVERILSKLSVG
jgi:hypothetical protein